MLIFLLFTLPSPSVILFFFFFNDTATTEIYTLSLHDALPIFLPDVNLDPAAVRALQRVVLVACGTAFHAATRSEEHTSELQSQSNLVCRLLLEKKKKKKHTYRVKTQ